MSRVFALIASCALVGLACDNLLTDLIEGPGTFTATVTGDVTSEFSGRAVFGDVELSGGGTAFAVALISSDTVDGEPSDLIVFLDEGERDIGEGTNALLEYRAWSDTTEFGTLRPPFAIYVNPNEPDVGLTAYSEGGEIELSEASTDRFAGSFDFPAQMLLITSTSTDTIAVQATGSFDAIPGDPQSAF